jgi:GDP-L-fucose synthase
MERYDSKDIGEFGNIGVGEDLKIKNLANLVKEVVGFDGSIDWERPSRMVHRGSCWT